MKSVSNFKELSNLKWGSQDPLTVQSVGQRYWDWYWKARSEDSLWD